MLNKPKKLEKGDKIGFICPSFKTDVDKIALNLEVFKEMGFEVSCGKSLYLKNDYLAGSDEDRKNDLESMFLNPEIKGIVCYQGGYGASRLLDLINYDIIKKNPKFFFGYSDITVFNNVFLQKANLPTYQGKIGAQALTVRKDFFSYQSFYEDFLYTTKGRVLKNPISHKARTITNGRAEGVLVGGNLSLIYALLGTPYEIDFKEKIILLEDVSEKPYAIDRMLQSLKLASKLQEAKGFVIGQFSDCAPPDKKEHEFYRDVDYLIDEFLKPLNVPVLANFCNGHSMPNISLPIGLKVCLDADKKTITILEEFYKE